MKTQKFDEYLSNWSYTDNWLYAYQFVRDPLNVKALSLSLDGLLLNLALSTSPLVTLLGQRSPCILKFDIFLLIFSKKGWFLSFQCMIRNLTNLGLPPKILFVAPGKIHFWPLEKIFPRHMLWQPDHKSVRSLLHSTYHKQRDIQVPQNHFLLSGPRIKYRQASLS